MGTTPCCTILSRNIGDGRRDNLPAPLFLCWTAICETFFLFLISMSETIFCTLYNAGVFGLQGTGTGQHDGPWIVRFLTAF